MRRTANSSWSLDLFKRAYPRKEAVLQEMWQSPSQKQTLIRSNKACEQCSAEKSKTNSLRTSAGLWSCNDERGYQKRCSSYTYMTLPQQGNGISSLWYLNHGTFSMCLLETKGKRGRFCLRERGRRLDLCQPLCNRSPSAQQWNFLAKSRGNSGPKIRKGHCISA